MQRMRVVPLQELASIGVVQVSIRDEPILMIGDHARGRIIAVQIIDGRGDLRRALVAVTLTLSSHFGLTTRERITRAISSCSVRTRGAAGLL